MQTTFIIRSMGGLDDDMAEVDGGMVLLEELLRDKYHCMAECIPDMLGMAYGCMAGFIILNQ